MGTFRATPKVAEVRAEHLLTELLISQGWDTRRPPNGELLRQQEYKDHSHLLDVFVGISKSGGSGSGLPEAILVDRQSLNPIAVIEVKAKLSDLNRAIREVTDVYAQAFVRSGYTPLAVALAGTSEEEFAVKVFKWNGARWSPVTYDGHPIGWIPNRADAERISIPSERYELRPSVPPPEVLAGRADEINRLLRESGIKDEFRPAVVGAIMLALWQSKGNIRKDPEHILADINEACRRAFWVAKKPDLAVSLRVDEANDVLASKARRIVTILERLNVTVLTAEHDYLGQLYETFFRYTGGNTIGQYFTPRHIARMMADLCGIQQSDIVLDPACGTGGFLVAAMNRVLETSRLSRIETVKLVRTHLIGFDKEPVTAALCVANMILRGDGSTGVRRADVLTSKKYPLNSANVVLMNPPFPHKKTDTPPELFIERGLQGLRDKGLMAVIVPRSMLAKKDKQRWRARILEHNTLEGVIVLPDELFEPYASSYTATLLISKGIKHKPDHKAFFARIENDGLRMRKGVRVPRPGEEMSAALRAYWQHETTAGFCGWSELDKEAGWDAGYYIPARKLSETEVRSEVALLVRNRAAFVVNHAPELATLTEALDREELQARDYRLVRHLKDVAPQGDTLGGYFDIVYGQKALHSKERLSPGRSLVISSSGIDNGCYGFFDYEDLIAPPFITVPSTGSLAMAHVQEWPCGVTDDCLLMLPRRGVPLELLYVAAAVVRNERWRFNYGMKVTPRRISGFPLPMDRQLIADVRCYLDDSRRIEQVAMGQTPGVPQTPAIPPSFSDEFRTLVKQWRRDTRHISSLAKMASHPAYRRIMGMGRDVLPLLLNELRQHPDHWLIALNAITGEDPAPQGATFDEAVSAWLSWGREKGLLK